MSSFTKFVYLNIFNNLFLKYSTSKKSKNVITYILKGSWVCNGKVSRCLIIRKPLGQLLMYLIETIFTPNHLWILAFIIQGL
jgi:hypothetical protein